MYFGWTNRVSSDLFFQIPSVLSLVSNLRADEGRAVLVIEELLIAMPSLGCIGVKFCILIRHISCVGLHCRESRAAQVESPPAFVYVENPYYPIV